MEYVVNYNVVTFCTSQTRLPKSQQSRINWAYIYRATLVGYTKHTSMVRAASPYPYGVSVPNSAGRDGAVSLFIVDVVCPLYGGNNYWVLHSTSP